ncbi:1,4-dihydroxy-2-naphthoate polyprenyltransferase [Amnibacterium sp. CER49]|uniref:1,4-dihydroxy-2-naphthoate polyprenyltransferase n=1 Tax=Amnibacterium sp. CER49 TaxID=3039161 RepID=UPI00244A898F|nr:1,4-dihydroxy-2-naphthoate polyprenyltransferase [Amnibacterium sp. CER49]MDH2443410.1 1,4-dihydroxy-2-naphthoate polyprenyltransferase [Amnibacterium sp. CER49]
MDGARPRTLPLAIAPVALGTGAAVGNGRPAHLWLAWLCLAVALLLQIGVNFANDYSDGIRGTDAFRVGPARLTGSGRAKPRTVLAVALVCFALAAVAGLAIVVVTQVWWLLAVGALAIVAAWFYTGGRRPYGYAGLGEVVVFLFFGLAATAGTTFVLLGLVNAEGWFTAVAIGCIACAVLLVNNLRDLEQDRAAGKRTLSVRIGARGTRVLFAVLLLVPYLVLGYLTLFYPSASLVFLTLLLAGPAVIITVTGRTPRELVLALSLTGLTALFYGLGLAAALAL